MREENSVVIQDYGKKKKFRICTVFIVIVCIVGIIVGIKTDFFRKSCYELQNRLNNKIWLSTGIYVGDTDFGVFTGEGIFQFSSGTTYKGNWQNYEMEGFGTLSYPDEGEYVGQFSGSQKEGQGIFTWKNGDVYDGNWAHDMMSGNGKYTFSDGRTLIGVFEDNVFITGTYTASDLSGHYTVSYKNGKMYKATILFSDGTTYDGGCKNGLISDVGVLVFPNGDTYEGAFLAGQRSGEGTYSWNFGDKYTGTWEFDAMCGDGRYTFAAGDTLNGKFADNEFISGTYYTNTKHGTYMFTLENKVTTNLKMSLNNGMKYQGGFSKGKLNGAGELTYPSGDFYNGTFSTGIRSGQGTYLWKDGSKYTGAWKNDKMNGFGTFYYASSITGYKLEGNFEDNSPSGDCVYYETLSRSYSTVWKNGICQKITE